MPTPTPTLSAVATSKSKITLSWLDEDYTGVLIEQSATGNAPWPFIVRSDDFSAITYLVSGLSPLTTYYFRMKGSIASVDSDYSNTASATTLPDIDGGLVYDAGGATAESIDGILRQNT